MKEDAAIERHLFSQYYLTLGQCKGLNLSGAKEESV